MSKLYSHKTLSVVTRMCYQRSEREQIMSGARSYNLECIILGTLIFGPLLYRYLEALSKISKLVATYSIFYTLSTAVSLLVTRHWHPTACGKTKINAHWILVSSWPVCNFNSTLLSYCWECVSLLANSFNFSQETALVDYNNIIEVAVMHRYNNDWSEFTYTLNSMHMITCYNVMVVLVKFDSTWYILHYRAGMFVSNEEISAYIIRSLISIAIQIVELGHRLKMYNSWTLIYKYNNIIIIIPLSHAGATVNLLDHPPQY